MHYKALSRSISLSLLHNLEEKGKVWYFSILQVRKIEFQVVKDPPNIIGSLGVESE